MIAEQISREIRQAMPVSIRTSADGRCVEWMPVVAASTYLNLSLESPISQFTAMALPAGNSVSGRIALYGYGNNLYQTGSAGPLSPAATLPAGSGEVTVTLAQAHHFTTGSPQRRFFVVDNPVTLCQVGSLLYRYQGYGVQSALGSGLPTAFPGREVLAAELVPSSVSFAFVPPDLQRNAVVQFGFTLMDERSGETTSLTQEVHIRNVP